MDLLWHILGQAPTLPWPLDGWWAYVAIAVLVFLEGPIATLLGAVAAASGWLNPYLVFLAASAGNLAADNFWYFLGYLGKTEWILRHGKWLGVRRHHLDRLTRDLHNHAVPVILLAKLTATFMIPTLVAAGLVRVPWRRTILALFIGECIWTGGLVFLGYHFASSLRRLELGVQIVSAAAAVVMLFLLARYVRRVWVRHWQVANAESTPPGSEGK